MENLPEKSEPKYDLADVADKVNAVRQLMRQIMVEKTDWMVIPGTDKPSLLKPGAEKLCQLFHLRPHCKNEQQYMDGNHLRVVATCEVRHIKTGDVWGEASAICSTMEPKYRYRYRYDYVDEVPRGYWKLSKQEQVRSIPAGSRVKKVEGRWGVYKAIIAENPDIAEAWNTVVKMAEKRAFVAATLYATAGSGIFTQDMEDTLDTNPFVDITPEPDESPFDDAPPPKPAPKKRELPEIPDEIDKKFAVRSSADSCKALAKEKGIKLTALAEWPSVERAWKDEDWKQLQTELTKLYEVIYKAKGGDNG